MAVTVPSLTATGWSRTVARTSTPSPVDSTQGARMNTARTGPSAIWSISMSSSKLAELTAEGVLVSW